MIHPAFVRPASGVIALSVALLALHGCSSLPGEARATSTPAHPSPGATAVHKPGMIYVSDFYIDPSELEKQTLLSQNRLPGRVLGRLRGDSDPEAKARELVTVLSESIVDTLKSAGYPAQRFEGSDGLRQSFLPADATLPKEGWMVGGWFTRADEGNAAVQATVGFGAGSDHIEVQVAVSDLAVNVADPFLFIGTQNQERRMPGGLVARNPYAIAAKMVLSRGATERDVRSEGAAIARNLIDYVEHGPAAK